VGITDWNWLLDPDRQDYPWDCAACSLAWALRSIGLEMSEEEVISGLGPGRINATYGLLDASGAGLISYLAELGVTADNNPAATWRDMTSAAGFQPMIMGGRRWYHWAAVRMGPDAIERPDLDYLALMNPSPGWMGVNDQMAQDQFLSLGPFSAVWFETW